MYRHSAESIKETDNKIFVSLEEKTKFNNYENTLRRKDDSYSKTEVEAKIKELSDATYGNVESSYISESNTLDGYVKDLEIMGNTIQNTENLADIKSVGELQEDGTYKMSIVSCGKNLFDGKISVGHYNPSGNLAHDYKGVYISDTFIPVNNTEKYVVTSLPSMINDPRVKPFDKDFNNIVGDLMKDGGPYVFPEEVKYVKFQFNNVNYDSELYDTPFTEEEIETIKNSFVFMQSDSLEDLKHNTGYSGTRVDINLPCQLEKVGDVSDRLYYDEDEKAWCVEKNVGEIILNGTEEWGDNSSQYPMDDFSFFYCEDFQKIMVDTPTNTFNLLCDKFEVYRIFDTGIFKEGIVVSGSENVWIKIAKSKLNTQDTTGLKTWLSNNNTTLKHQLITPQKIILPLSTQIQLNSYANKTHIYTVSGEIEPTIKATLPKSLGASVQSLNDKTDVMIERIKNIETLKEGQNISYESDKGFVLCENTNNGQIDNIKIEGKTLVNALISNTNVTNDFSEHYPNWGIINIATDQTLFKENTVYTFVVNITKNTTGSTISDAIWFGDVTGTKISYTDDIVRIPCNITQKVFTIKTVPSFLDKKYSFSYQFSKNISTGIVEIEVSILEGDHTQNPPSYFEGIKSVGGDVDEIKVLSRKEDGNLFDKNNVMYNTMASTVTGVITTNSNYVISDLIPVASNKEYISTNLTVVHFYDKDNKFISAIDTPTSPQIFTTPYNCKFIRVRNWTPLATLQEKVDAINKNIVTSSLNTSDISCEYYKPHTKSLLYYNDLGELVPVPELHEWDSIEKHDDGKWYYHKRSEKIVLNGNEAWNIHSSISSWFYTDNLFNGHMNHSLNDFIITDKFNQVPYTNSANINNGELTYGSPDGTIKRLICRSTSHTTVEAFKTWLKSNNVTLLYRLATEEVYECVNLNLDTYDNETMVSCNSGAISPKLSLIVSSHVGNTVSILRERLKAVEEEYIDYRITQDKLLLNTLYSSDRGSYSVSTLSSDYEYQELEEIDYELFEIAKSVIEVGLDNYNITDMEELIDFYTLVGKFDYDMADVLFEMIENQINPPIIEIPEEEIEILPEI